MATTGLNSTLSAQPPARGGERLWFTPPEIAWERGLRTAKVLTWIRTGELLAINHATKPNGPPRWKISAAALAAFDAARSSRAVMGATEGHCRVSTTRKSGPRNSIAVKEYF